eukprot:6778401-Prymnesium_polylepis.1
MARNHFFKSLKGTSLIPGGSGAGQGAVSADLVDADDLLSSGEVKAAIFHPFLYTHLHKPDEQRSAPGLVYQWCSSSFTAAEAARHAHGLPLILCIGLHPEAGAPHSFMLFLGVLRADLLLTTPGRVRWKGEMDVQTLGGAPR